MGSGGMFPRENFKFSEPLEHYFRHSGRTFDVAKCNLVVRETRLLASSLPKTVYRVAGGFVQGCLDFTARLWMSNHSGCFLLLDSSH